MRSKKVQLHVYEYELFKMKSYESITKMTNRLNTLLTILRKLGKHYSKEDVNTKILRVLPKNNWESRVTSIEESHYLSKLSTNILIGKLLTHQLILRQREEQQQEPSNFCFMALEDAFEVPSCLILLVIILMMICVMVSLMMMRNLMIIAP